MNPITNLKSAPVNVIEVIRRPWLKAEEDVLVSLILRGIHYDTIANRLDRTYSAVANRAIKLGYSKKAMKRSPSTRIDPNITRKTSKRRITKNVKVSNLAPLLTSKIKNYRILVGTLVVAQAATLTMLAM